jgi:hypothetical protein
LVVFLFNLFFASEIELTATNLLEARKRHFAFIHLRQWFLTFYARQTPKITNGTQNGIFKGLLDGCGVREEYS